MKYYVWTIIEEVDEDKDLYEDIVGSDVCVGKFSTKEEAEIYQGSL